MINIKEATIDDFNIIKDIENLSNEFLISDENLKNDLKNNTTKYFIAYNNNSYFGFVGTSYILDTMDILSILIVPDARKKGIASKLLEYVLNFSKLNNISKIFLEVRKSNLPAISLYKKYDFNQISIRKKYYNNLEDAIIMEKLV